MAKEILGRENFYEIFLDCSVEVCEQRDTKGLYKKARNGEIKEFTGISAPFETPKDPALILHTDIESMEESLEKLVKAVEREIKYS